MVFATFVAKLDRKPRIIGTRRVNEDMVEEILVKTMLSNHEISLLYRFKPTLLTIVWIGRLIQEQ